MDFGQLGDYIREHPKAAAIVGGVAGVATIYGLTRKRGTAEQEQDDMARVEPATVRYDNGETSEFLDTYRNYPVINVSVPETKVPSPSTVPPTKYTTIFRKGQAQKITAGPPGLVCPPGYVAAQQAGQPPRCTRVTDVGKKPGERTSFFPGQGQGQFVNR